MQQTQPFELLLSSEVIEAARDHAQVLDADPDFIERELEALYEEWSEERELVGAGVGNEQTPTLPRRGLKYDILVGRKGLEPLTPCASCRCSSQLS